MKASLLVFLSGFAALQLASAATTKEFGVASKAKAMKEKPTAGVLVEEAQSAYARNDRTEAMSLLNRAIKMDPNHAQAYFARARLYSVMGQPDKAVEDFNKTLGLYPSQPDVYQLRGLEHFRAGHVVDALNDFNAYLAANPAQEPYHWQRGIALYYCDRFEEGRRQFELHQTVNSKDVENAAWHFFCTARSQGVEKARAALIPITGDARVPMMAIHALLAGKGTPDAVLEAANAGSPRPETARQQLFYAHLYLGLYYEVLGDEKASREHMSKAVALGGKEDYMATVARVHSKQTRSIKAKN